MIASISMRSRSTAAGGPSEGSRPRLITAPQRRRQHNPYHKNPERHSAFAGAFHNPWRMHMSNLSRRSVVASTAALPVLAVPAVAVAAVEADPVFAAIEEHKRFMGGPKRGGPR
jgi:hypothetical protein